MSAQENRLVVEEIGDGIAVRFSKNLSLHDDNIPHIATELFQVADRLGQRTLSLDLGLVAFLTSSALCQLISLHKKVGARGGRLILCNLSPTVYEVFEITRLSSIMEIKPSVAPPPVQTLRILIVDDSADAADSLRRLLDLWGHETRVACDGPAALEAADAFRPQVVLLDIQMPGMSGGEVAVRLRRRPGHESLLLVATTATASDDPRLAPYNGLFNHYLRKPYNLERLEGLLAACVAQTLPEDPNTSPEREP